MPAPRPPRAKSVWGLVNAKWSWNRNHLIRILGTCGGLIGVGVGVSVVIMGGAVVTGEIEGFVCLRFRMYSRMYSRVLFGSLNVGIS